MFKKSILTLTVVSAFTMAPAAQAADYPTKPVRLVVGYAAGGPSDTITRIVSDALAKKWDVPVIVENRPGATATIATGYVANSAADGYTLAIIANDFIASRFVYPELKYDAEKDITPIGMLAITPNVLVVSKESGYTNYKDFARDLVAANGDWSYSSTGVASTSHLAAEQFKKLTGYQANHIPYKGFAPSLPDLMTGRINFAVPSLSSVRTHIDAGNLVPLAIIGRDRSRFLPDTPTFEEEGVSNFDLHTWYALAGPAGVNQDILLKINQDLNDVLKDEEVVEKIRNQGTEVIPMSLEEIADHINEDLKTTSELVKGLSIENK